MQASSRNRTRNPTMNRVHACIRTFGRSRAMAGPATTSAIHQIPSECGATSAISWGPEVARRTAVAAYWREADIRCPDGRASAAANPAPSHLDQSPAQPLVDGFGAAGGAELAEQRFDVKLHGVLRNPEP